MNEKQSINQQPTYELTIDINGDLEEELEDALEYLRERLVGQIPPVLTEFSSELSKTLWAGYERDGVEIHLVREDGEPLTASSTEQTPEEIKQEEAAVEAYFAWESSPEGQAELEQGERLYEFRESRSAETAELYAAWLEERAQEFQLAKREWQRQRDAALKEQFESQAQAGE